MPASSDPPILDADDTRLLVEIGFLALTAGAFAQARDIFDGALAARPSGEAGTLGLALTAMADGKLDEAVALLRALPPSDAATAYLGLALLRRGDRAEALRLLRHVAERAADPAFRVLAETALRETETQ